MAIQRVTLGLNAIVWIPRGWDRFVFRGVVYERLDGVNFVRAPFAGQA